MIVIVALILFFFLFFLVRRHVGPAALAVIAGVAVFQLFGSDFISFISSIAPNIDIGIVSNIIYLTLILLFPLILYFRSDHGGFRGIMRIVEAAIFAILITALISDVLASFFSFDSIARDLAHMTNAYAQGYILLAGVIFAYIDILMYHKPKSRKD